MPALTVFQTFPEPTARYQVLGCAGWRAMSAIRPDMRAGPILRSLMPLSRAASSWTGFSLSSSSAERRVDAAPSRSRTASKPEERVVGKVDPPQEHVPFYQWNNTHEGSNIEVYVHNNCEAHIQENRDFYNNVERPDYTPYTYPHPLIEHW